MADGLIPPMRGVARRLHGRVALSKAEAEAIERLPHTTREVRAGAQLIRQGDHPTQCMVLTSGYLFRHKVVKDGARQILSVHVAGDFVDLQNILLAEADHNVEALTGAVIVEFSHGALLDLAYAKPAIGKALWRESLAEAGMFREWIANNGRRDARARVAHLLCEIALRREVAGLGPRAEFELPMTQEQLGDALALTAVHVNRTLMVLQDEGLIDRMKRSMRVLDWARLSAVADFDPCYLHIGRQGE